MLNTILQEVQEGADETGEELGTEIGGNDQTQVRDELKPLYEKIKSAWFNDGEMIQWWSPHSRFVLYPERLKVSKSMKQLFRKNAFEVTVNKAFEEVVRNCSTAKRRDQPGTWITESMVNGYSRLHEQGLAKSVEVWQNSELVGGLYGVDLGNGVFCGESMFSLMSNASKLALIHLVENHNYKLIDCQMYTDHLASLGAKEISRELFLEML